MKIEFRKVPSTKKEINVSFDSVKLEGTFCKISQRLVEIKSTLSGNVTFDCYKCGVRFEKYIDEELDFLISDGIYSGDSEDLIIEVEDHIIDFDEIIESELSSIKSDYHPCEECSKNDDLINKEY
jgi:hypothetical protein